MRSSAVRCFKFLVVTVLFAGAHYGGVDSLATPAADADAGKALVLAECTLCHGDEVYTAEDRKVDELDKLWDKVDMCTEPAGVEWNQAQLADVVEYLNRRFYQLK